MRLPRSIPVWLVLAVGTLAVSTAAPLIRLVGMPALAVAAWRTTGAALFYGALTLGPLRARGGQERGLRGALDLASLVGGAALLAAHFGLWIAAFEHTSYASSVLLLVLQPVFGALLGRAVLGERLRLRMAIGIGAALIGLLLLVYDDLGEPHHLFGDGLAVAGTLAIALYYIVVGRARRRLAFAPFMTQCYGLAGVMLVTAAALTSTPLTTTAATGGWGFLALLVLAPTVVGHACFNWCLGRVPLFTLNMLIVLEPALALVLGAWWLGTGVSPWQMAGGVVLGTAVLVGLGRPAAPETPSA